MLYEISVAVNYVQSHLYNKLPRRRVDSFGEELGKYLQAKFQNHWFPSDPPREAEYRRLTVAGQSTDIFMPEAAVVSGLDWVEIQACLPECLIISIDPGHVAIQYTTINTMDSIGKYAPGMPWQLASGHISLSSSSGCSSAASSTSSTNAGLPHQLIHQVLYCPQDSWSVGSSNSSWTETLSSEPTSRSMIDNTTTTTIMQNDQGDSLATETALSVLFDSDDKLDHLKRQYGMATDLKSSQMLKHWNETRLSGQNGHPADLSGLKSRFDLACRVDYDDHSTSNSNNNNNDFGKFTTTAPGGDLPFDMTAAVDIGPAYLQAGGPGQEVKGQSVNMPSRSSQHLSNHPMFLSHHHHQQQHQQPPGQDRPILTPGGGGGGYCYPTPTPQSQHNSANFQLPPKSTSTPSFTAATFAQTKFGSTKLKNQSKRNSAASTAVSSTTAVSTVGAPRMPPGCYNNNTQVQQPHNNLFGGGNGGMNVAGGLGGGLFDREVGTGHHHHHHQMVVTSNFMVPDLMSHQPSCLEYNSAFQRFTAPPPTPATLDDCQGAHIGTQSTLLSDRFICNNTGVQLPDSSSSSSGGSSNNGYLHQPPFLPSTDRKPVVSNGLVRCSDDFGLPAEFKAISACQGQARSTSSGGGLGIDGCMSMAQFSMDAAPSAHQPPTTGLGSPSCWSNSLTGPMRPTSIGHNWSSSILVPPSHNNNHTPPKRASDQATSANGSNFVNQSDQSTMLSSRMISLLLADDSQGHEGYLQSTDTPDRNQFSLASANIESKICNDEADKKAQDEEVQPNTRNGGSNNSNGGEVNTSDLIM